MKVTSGDSNNDGVTDLFILHKRPADTGAKLHVPNGGTFGGTGYSFIRQLPNTADWVWADMKMPTVVE